MSTANNEEENDRELTVAPEPEPELTPPEEQPLVERPLIQSAQEGRLKRKRQERLALTGTLIFAGLVAVGAWLTEGRIFMVPWNAVMKYEAAGRASRDPGINCRLPKNKNTPYCLNRQAEVDAQWENIVRSGRGEQPFTLHGR